MLKMLALVILVAACGTQAAKATQVTPGRYLIRVDDDVDDESVLEDIHLGAARVCPLGYSVEKHEDEESKTAIILCDRK